MIKGTFIQKTYTINREHINIKRIKCAGKVENIYDELKSSVLGLLRKS